MNNNYPGALSVLRAAIGLSLLVLAMQGTVLGFALLYFVMFFFNGVSDSPHATLFNNQIPRKVRSTLLSFQSVMLQLGGLGGSLIIGLIAKTHSIPFAWTTAAVAIILSSGTYIILMTPRFKSSSLETARANPPSQTQKE
jgi:sugar phosphate permease